MKLTIILALALVAVGVGLHFAPSDYTVVNERNETVTKEEEPVVILDSIEKAKQELDRINAELDTEETQLLEDIKGIESEAAAKVAEKKVRIEKIREARDSFQ